MGTVMKASEFVKKLKDVAENYDTLYVMGCFGAPMTNSNKTRYCNNHKYNMNPTRTKMIQAASSDTFGFDCVCLIKGILWGWNGNKYDKYGGADYKANGVEDLGANDMIKICSDLSTDFSNIEIGEAVWTRGHIGVYIGNGLAVECTPSWENKVQITACNCNKSGYNTRKWVKHGKLPYIDYDSAKKLTKIKPAQEKDKSLAGTYKVNAVSGLYIRTGPGTDNESLRVLKCGEIVRNYGYYSMDEGTPSSKLKWMYVLTSDGIEGYCSARYLKKC